jgi:hypothetical protein
LDHVGVQIEAWLNQDSQFVPGQEIFRCEHDFAVWAFTVSHSQLLQRARVADGKPRIDILFKPVEAMKVRTEYNGLIIRCGTVAESDRILASSGLAGQALRVLVIETAEASDYVVTGAVGWREGDAGSSRPPTAGRTNCAFTPTRASTGRARRQSRSASPCAGHPS